jgi:hypothetical protein
MPFWRLSLEFDINKLFGELRSMEIMINWKGGNGDD